MRIDAGSFWLYNHVQKDRKLLRQVTLGLFYGGGPSTGYAFVFQLKLADLILVHDLNERNNHH